MWAHAASSPLHDGKKCSRCRQRGTRQGPELAHLAHLTKFDKSSATHGVLAQLCINLVLFRRCARWHLRTQRSITNFFSPSQTRPETALYSLSILLLVFFSDLV